MAEEIDGGYYAIKGFLYQFDKTLIEVINNGESEFEIEKKQDISYQEFVIQVKHKETQNFSPSKIAKPVLQLIRMYKKDPNQKFCLYCYFKDKVPQKWKPSEEELEQILGKNSQEFNQIIKDGFINNFEIIFSEDYEAQFLSLIKIIKSNFSLESDQLAILYHSIFRSRLLDISINCTNNRKVNRSNLQDFLDSTEYTIFYSAYEKYLGKGKYESLIKKRYFTTNRVNIENFERLFIVECKDNENETEIIKLISHIGKKYFIRNKSPQPFLCFRNIENSILNQIKRELINSNIWFFDGTYFDGDMFRFGKIIEKTVAEDSYTIKLFPLENLSKFDNLTHFNEVFQFYIDEPINIEKQKQHIKIQISEIEQIIRII